MKQLKSLLPLGDATVTDFAVSIFKRAGVDVFLVVGHRQEEVKAGIKLQGITVIYNPDYEKGMLSSVQAGIRHLGGEYQAFFLLPVDIPMVMVSTIERLINAWSSHPENIIYPVYKGKRGHPPLVPASLIPAILAWKREGGLKTFLDSRADIAHEVDVTDSFILLDIDTQEDYVELQKRYREYVQAPEHRE